MNFKEKAEEILKVIQSSKKILLHLHPRPDGDSVGSALAMQQVLQGLGKDATVIKGDSLLPAYLSHLPGFDTIVQKNIFEIDLTQFDLFIAQDVSSLGMISSLGEIIFPPPMQIVRIDHHQTEANFADINLVMTDYPANCELLFDLFKEWNVEISHNIALNLFVGIYTDTGGFKYPSVRPNTFIAAAALATKAPDFPEEIALLEEHTPIEQITYEAIALSLVKSFAHGKILVSAVSYDDLKKFHIPKEHTILGGTLHIPNQLKSVVGCELGVSLVEEEPNIVKVSLRRRTQSSLDLSNLAEALNGGGHKAAAGAVIKSSLEDAQAKVLKEIETIYGSEIF